MSFEVRVRHRFGDFLLDAEFSAPAGLTVLFGTSGAGKTSLLNAIAGLFRPDEARISVGGNVLVDTARRAAVPVHQRRLGCVFQDARLFPHLSVRQNLEFGRRFHGGAGKRSRPEPADPVALGDSEVKAEEIVDLLGIVRLLDRKPGGLSGGERQRVAIGRALLSRPRALLMDEPLAALDDARKQEILPVIERLRDRFGIPILYVSHAVPEVTRLATTMIRVENGRVVRQGPARQVSGDRLDLHVAGMSDETRGGLLGGRVAGHCSAGGCTFVTIAGVQMTVPRVDAPVGALVQVSFPPAAVMLSDRKAVGGAKGTDDAGRTANDGAYDLNRLPVLVTTIGEDGQQPGLARVGLRIGEDEFHALVMARIIRDLNLEPGRSCCALVNPAAVRVRIA